MTEQSRRRFLQTGVAMSVLPVNLSGWALEAETFGQMPSGSETAVLPLDRVLFDRRFPPSVTFANAAAALGASTVGFDGDITDIWFRDLSLRWAREPVAIAGLTAHGPLFCLERWAWDHGLRVLYQARHERLDEGRAGHAIRGAQAVVQRVRQALVGTDFAWSESLAPAMSSCPPGRTALITDHVITTPCGDLEAGEPLFSWVIAPHRRT